MDSEDIWAKDYVNEEHLQAFAAALAQDDEAPTSEVPNSPIVAPRQNHPHHPERTQKISAVSDFAPIHSRVKRKKRKGEVRGKQGVWYHILRWPLLALIFSVIYAEFGLYVFIRQCVNMFEWLVAWRGRKGVLRKKLRVAKTYEEWKETAKELDEYLSYNEWKKEPEDPFYDYTLIKKVLRSLRTLRDQDDAHGVLGVLEVCIRANFGGIESYRLYSETYYKTKDLIEAYTTEVEYALAYIRETPKLSIEEKRKFFRGANTNLGSSALCLSGGASFGYYHFGVVRAFLDAKMLPRVIAGTSAGGLIAALVCTHTDEELETLLVPKLADHITACEEPIRVWMTRFWKTGARFDTVEWARKSAFFTRGSLTFREAYELTGRVLNVSVIPFSRYSPTKLLNHLTSPDCVIWSAIIASAAVPGILNPVVLMQKTKTGSIVPWNWGSRFKDGSLRVDIPLQSLNLLFNVNYPIVSQVNPHVHLFNFSPRGSAGKPVVHRKGKGWRGGFILSAAEQYLKLELTKNFKVIRDLELLPQILGQDWSSVFLQRFDGAVTFVPFSVVSYLQKLIMSIPQQDLASFSDTGLVPPSHRPGPARVRADDARRTVGNMAQGMLRYLGRRFKYLIPFRQLHMIENRYRLEREIYRGRVAVRQALAVRERSRVPPETDHGADADTPGAGPSTGVTNGRLTVPGRGRSPWPSATSSHLPVESEAEAGYRAQLDPRLWRRGAEGVQIDSSNDPTPNSSGAMRRRWANSYVRDQIDDEDEDEDEAEAEASRSPPPRAPSPNANRVQRSGSFLDRFRTQSFPHLSFGRIPHPFGRGATHEAPPQRPPPIPYIHGNGDVPSNDRYDSSETEDEADIPWSGATMSPRIGSRMSLGDASLGLSFLSSPSTGRGKEKAPENGDAMMDELDEEGSLSDRDALPDAGGVTEGLDAEAAAEPGIDEPVPPQQDRDV
ncbi:hypothetical protein FRC04_000337 [Tulasnella sp. 424]|nr:hypothetical protein FRC04_000337 [Tulasnella sp. 424]KAG8982197.1 hypothetical protein FRC05_000339 [Tulasnella sp. 425]